MDVEGEKSKAAPGSKVPLKTKKKKKRKGDKKRRRKDEDEEDRIGNAVEGVAAIGAMHVGAAGLAGAVAARAQMNQDGEDDNQLANEDAGAILDGAADDGGAVDGFFDLGLGD